MKLRVMMFAAAALISTPALALDLATARAAGTVCEKTDGYLAPKGGGSDVQALVNSVNAGRKAEYARIAKENGQTPEVAAKIGAQTLQQKGVAFCR